MKDCTMRTVIEGNVKFAFNGKSKSQIIKILSGRKKHNGVLWVTKNNGLKALIFVFLN